MDDKNNAVVTYRTPDYVEKYSNNIQVNGGALDFWIQFGRSIRPEPGEDGPIVVEFFAGIVLSPPEAKLLACMLSEEVRMYEKRFGALPTMTAPAPAESAEPAAATGGEVIQ